MICLNEREEPAEGIPFIRIAGKVVGPRSPVLIVCELACAHEGRFSDAKAMVEAASAAGCDAVKFHLHTLDEYVVPAHPVYGFVKQIAFSPGQWRELFALARSKGLLIEAMPNDASSAALCREISPDFYYIHSANIADFRLVREMAKAGKPVLIGVGACTDEEIEAVIGWLRDGGVTQIGLMHGHQSYPTQFADMNISYISHLSSKYGLPVGYMDHTAGDDPLALTVPILALPYGACILEKHVVVDRSRKGVDWESALNPGELAQFVKNVRSAEVDRGMLARLAENPSAKSAIGTPEPRTMSESEKKYRDLVKKNVVAARDIGTEETITEEMLAFKRSPPPGLSPLRSGDVVGKKAKQAIKKNSNVMREMVE